MLNIPKKKSEEKQKENCRKACLIADFSS